MVDGEIVRKYLHIVFVTQFHHTVIFNEINKFSWFSTDDTAAKKIIEMTEIESTTTVPVTKMSVMFSVSLRSRSVSL